MAAFILWISWFGVWLPAAEAWLLIVFLFVTILVWFPFLIPSLLYFLCPAANKGYRMQVYHSCITLNFTDTFHPVCTVISFSGKGHA